MAGVTLVGLLNDPKQDERGRQGLSDNLKQKASLTGNEPDWHALRLAHPDRMTWIPYIKKGSSDLSHEPWHCSNNFGVHVHAAELAALLSVPLRNLVAVPDTATMIWVETARQNQDTLKKD